MNPPSSTDTLEPDGVYIDYSMALPVDDLVNSAYALTEDDDTYFIGVQAVAHIRVVRNGIGTDYTLTSPGLWGISSDMDAAYLNETFLDEYDILTEDMQAIGMAIVEALS